MTCDHGRDDCRPASACFQNRGELDLLRHRLLHRSDSWSMRPAAGDVDPLSGTEHLLEHPQATDTCRADRIDGRRPPSRRRGAFEADRPLDRLAEKTGDLLPARPANEDPGPLVELSECVRIVDIDAQLIEHPLEHGTAPEARSERRTTVLQDVTADAATGAREIERMAQEPIIGVHDDGLSGSTGIQDLGDVGRTDTDHGREVVMTGDSEGGAIDSRMDTPDLTDTLGSPADLGEEVRIESAPGQHVLTRYFGPHVHQPGA